MLADTDLSVAVLGLGYIGLPTAAVIAETWWDRGDDGLWHTPATW